MTLEELTAAGTVRAWPIVTRWRNRCRRCRAVIPSGIEAVWLTGELRGLLLCKGCAAPFPLAENPHRNRPNTTRTTNRRDLHR